MEPIVVLGFAVVVVGSAWLGWRAWIRYRYARATAPHRGALALIAFAPVAILLSAAAAIQFDLVGEGSWFWIVVIVLIVAAQVAFYRLFPPDDGDA